MAQKMQRANTLYGYPNPQLNAFPDPIVQTQDPTVHDQGPIGQIWVNTAGNTSFILTSITGGQSNWTTTPSGAGAFTSVTINPGNLTLTGGTSSINAAGNITATGVGTFGTLTAGATALTDTLSVTNGTTLNGALTVAGLATFNGGFAFNNANTFMVKTGDDVPGAITLETNGGAAETMILQVSQGTGAGSMQLTSTAGGIEITAGVAGNAALVLTTTNGGMQLISAGAGMLLAGTNQSITMTTGTGTLNLGIDNTGKTVNIGNGTGANTIAIGGSGANTVTIANVQTGGSLAIGTAMTTGTISIGGTGLQVGNFDLAPGTGAQQVTLANGNGVKHILVGGGTSANTMTFGGTGANVITIGNTQTGGSIAMGHAMTTGTISIGGTGLQTGNFDLAPGTGAQQVTLGNGGTGVKTILIGAGAIDNVVTLGSTTGAAQTTIQAGTGGLTLNSGTGGAVAIGNNVTTANISMGAALTTGVMTLGSTAAASSTVIQSGTAGMNLVGPLVRLNSLVNIYAGAGVPNNALALEAGDLFIRTDPAGATSRLYIATAANTWTNVTCAA